jgi:hypothetical protein
MSIQPDDDLLTALRANLRRIDEGHRDEDLTPDARELKQLVLRRIEIIEAAIENLKKVAGLDDSKKP